MPEPLDLAALERALHNTQWATHDRCTCTACENGRALIAELRATRAERDWLLTVEAADAMLCDALTRTERAEAERDDWRGTAANALKMQGAAIARAERDAAAIGRVEAVMGANPESRSGSALASDIRAALRGDNA